MQVQLDHDDLGTLDLGCDPYVVVSLQIGSPAVRAVARSRALADGTFDDTQFLGARAVTLALRLRTDVCDGGAVMQELIDRVVPYMSPKRRPVLSWMLPGSNEHRSMVVRGDSWPFVLDRPKHPGLGLSWVCPSGEILAGGDEAERCESIVPAAGGEEGRLYDEDYSDGGRGPYPFSLPIGARTIDNPGTAPAHWNLTIFGAVTNPTFEINGTTIAFNRSGGLVVPAGQSVVIDTRSKTVLMNGTPSDSRYDKVNFNEWTWNDVLLQPGENTIRFDGTSLGPNATAIICYTPTFLG